MWQGRLLRSGFWHDLLRFRDLGEIPRDSGHAPRYDWRDPGSNPPPDLAASRLAPKITQPGRLRPHALCRVEMQLPIQLLLGMIEHRIGKIRPRPGSAQTDQLFGVVPPISGRYWPGLSAGEDRTLRLVAASS
jgi:hypothetical protein